MTKTVAFFGDSFVGKYEGWVELFCKNYGYDCLHVGKFGADPIYPFEKWKSFNENFEGSVDVCVYSHTEPSRLFHPDPKIGITSGFAAEPGECIKMLKAANVNNYEEYTKAVSKYYLYLVYDQAEKIKSVLFPLGVDRYIEDNNRVFKKIIHLWSFAPKRTYVPNLKGWTAKSDWPLTMKTGMNVILDLTNLSEAEPEYKLIGPFDQRPLHFSNEYSWLPSQILNTAVEYYVDGGSLDFRPLVSEYSTWDQYVEAYNKIKKDLGNYE